MPFSSRLMTSPTSSTEHPDRAVAARRPWHATPWAASALAIGLVCIVAAWTGVWGVMRRPLWLDEIVTQLIANAPGGIWDAMRAGADFQPPLHYMLVRFTDALAGGASPVATRFVSLIAAVLTLGALAWTWRASLSLAATIAGVLALAAHPLFLGQAFEARPYALWILASALTAMALRHHPRGWLVAAAAVLLCVTHYFGVLSLVAIGAGVSVFALATRMPGRAFVRLTAPMLAGALALAACLPLARAQLAATGGRSWVSAPTAADVAFFLRFPWGWRPAAFVIVAAVLLVIARRIPYVAARWPASGRPLPTVTDIALFSTLLVPVLVVAVSVLYKPVLVLRYAAPATLAVATLTAFAVEVFPRPARWVAVLWLLRAAVFSFNSAATGARTSVALLAGEMDAVQHIGALGVPTISPIRQDAYRASELAADGPAVAWVSLSDSLLERSAAQAGVGLTREMLLVERDFGHAVQRTFHFPNVVTLEQARLDTAVALLRDPAYAAADSIWLPGRRACPVSNRLVVFAVPSAALRCDLLRAGAQAGPRR
jgi:hypothetical protein